MKRIGCHATKLERREYSSSDYKSYLQTIYEVRNESGKRITTEYKCEYGITNEWLCFYSSDGREWSSRYYFPNEWSVVNLSLSDEYGASVCCGFENRRSSHRTFRVDLFWLSRHKLTWEPQKAGLRDLGRVKLNNADVASYPGWMLLEWEEEGLFDCEPCGADFAFRTEKDGRLLYLPRLLPIGRLSVQLDRQGLLEMIRKSADPEVRLAGVILLSDPDALRSLCDGAEDPLVREKAAERLALYEKLGYFPPDACELSQLSEENEYGGFDFMFADEPPTTTQSVIHVLTHPNPGMHKDWMYDINDFGLAEYVSLHDEDEDTRRYAANQLGKLHG